MAYQAKYVSSTALAYSAVRRQAVRVLNYTSKLVTGIEPATFGPAVRRSNHYEVFLSYGTHLIFKVRLWSKRPQTNRSYQREISYDDALVPKHVFSTALTLYL